MVLHVSGADVGERSHAERVTARDAALHPRLARKIPEQRERRGAHGLEFIEVAAPAPLFRSRD